MTVNCRFHPEYNPTCHVCRNDVAAQAGQRQQERAEQAAAARAEPNLYCPTCARPRGNGHHLDECVCAAAGVEVVERLAVVPGGQRAALAAVASGVRSLGLVDVQRRSVMSTSEVNACFRALRIAGPRVPVTIEISLTDQGWRITAQPLNGQLPLGAAKPTPYTATLPACSCSRIPCARGNCANRAHCHGSLAGSHAEHIHRFVGTVAKTYPGRVTVPEVPRHPIETAA
jgi:hypothetical protein